QKWNTVQVINGGLQHPENRSWYSDNCAVFFFLPQTATGSSCTPLCSHSATTPSSSPPAGSRCQEGLIQAATAGCALPRRPLPAAKV
uniref:Uncharacterized protein n=1 Tax=Aegilops tauschii subsp. strangulata TaxID=200361 RepID=A0A453IPD8_AEGTS